MKRTPENIAELIIRYSEGEPLSDGEAKELWEWLNEDENNRSLLYESKYMLHKLKAPQEVDLDRCYKELTERIAAANSAMRPSRTLRRRVAGRTALYAASLMLAIAVGAGTSYFMITKPTYETGRIQISAGPGDTSEILLPDGSTVVLKPSSKLVYPISFTEKQRRVELVGEAFFDVARDNERPFMVESERQRIKVLGTSFNIMAYPGYDINQVTLLSGSVEMSVYDEDGGLARSFVMTPDQQATFDRASGVVALHLLSKNDASRNWADNVYCFENKPLYEIVGRLGHYYNVEIVVANPEIGSALYSGTLSLDMNIKDVLNALNIEKDFTVKGSGRRFTLNK